MAHEAHEFEGKSVEDAVAAGLSKLNMTQAQVSIEVLSKGSRGILGFGSEPARVRLTRLPESPAAPPKADDAQPAQSSPEETTVVDVRTEAEATEEELLTPEIDDAFSSAETVTMNSLDSVPAITETETEQEIADEPDEIQDTDEEAEPADEEDLDDKELADLASEMLLNMIELMGFNASVDAERREPDEQGNTRYLRLDIQGEDLGVLIGRRGETLTSIQYLLRLMINQRLRQWKNIVVDVEQYKERRIVQLGQLAQRMADQVAESGRPISLEPMPAGERRIVHIALRDRPDVYTASVGEDERRKVEIIPKD
jgi:spoIIIJ-associated protein